MNDSPVHDHQDGSELEVQVVPRASQTRIVGLHAGRLKIQLAAPPVDGAANAALVDLLADTLAVARGQVAVVRGHTGKRKTVRVTGVGSGELRRRGVVQEFATHPGRVGPARGERLHAERHRDDGRLHQPCRRPAGEQLHVRSSG